MKEITGIYYHMDVISPEAFKAQRMAELEQMARYRAMRLQHYKDWADPVKRKIIQTKFKAEEIEARKKLPDIPADLISVRRFDKSLTITKLVMLEPKTKTLTLFQKIKNWVHGIFS